MENGSPGSEKNITPRFDEGIQRAKLFKIGNVFLVALTFFIAVLSVNALAQFSHIGDDIPVHRTLSVSGEGEVFAIPDTATVNFQVIEEAPTVQEAQQASSDRMSNVLESLAGLEISEDNIKTLNYSLNPRYEYRGSTCEPGRLCPPNNERVLVGYEVRQWIEVKVDDNEKASDIVQALGNTGVQEISNIQFTIDDPDALQAEARGKAIQKARQKADQLASQLGVRLKRVVNYYEHEAGPGPVMYDMAAGLGGGETTRAPSLPTGENRIVSNVSIVYEIE